jgi:transposase
MSRAASAEDRGEVERLARTVQAVSDDAVELAWVGQGYAGERAANAAARHGIALEVVKLPEAKRGFVLLPRRWVVERSFAWATRFRRLVRNYGRYAETLAELHIVAFACLMMKQAATLAGCS